ncbi:MAG TPA: 3-isopropylmalate dehydratase small subunit [Polyangiaceae bacterium]|nr:3-isopropylmalate dehydratase small subunit [Polyangiaceae bacterium]
MALAKIERVTGRAVHVPGEDIDTDRIIPARYLKCVTFDGLGEHLFKDVRFGQDGSKSDHPLNDPKYAGATILVAGRNFGCGSSREHAPQSIAKYGFKAMIAESFAEIFFGNSTALGLPCVSLKRAELDELAARVTRDPQTVVTVDLAAGVVRVGDERTLPFEMKPGAQEALQHGSWDPIGQLLEGKEQIRKVAASLPYIEPR